MGAAFLPLKISLSNFLPALQRLLQQAPATVHQHVERVEEQGLSLRAVMLQEIERDPPAFIQGDDLAVEKRIPVGAVRRHGLCAGIDL